MRARTSVLLSLAASFCLVAIALSARAQQSIGFAGTWDSTYGELVLQQNGADVTGTYTYGGGSTVQGTVDGSRLTFRYVEPDVWGEGYFDLSADGMRLDGQWHEAGGSQWAGWTATRRDQRALPTAPGTNWTPPQTSVPALPSPAIPAPSGSSPVFVPQIGTTHSGGVFEGMYDSTYGRLRLVQNGQNVTGSYSYGNGSTVSGTVEGSRLTFQYVEPSASGEGWFEISPDGRTLLGQWRATGGSDWTAWTAQRAETDPNRRWLYVVEAYWEESLAEEEYAFGDMLRSWFTRYPEIEVRQRRVHDADDLRDALTEVAWLGEPSVIWIASHGSQGQLSIEGEDIPTSVITEALRGSPDVQLVHFSACEMGVGDTLESVREVLTAPGAAVSGYRVTVDWSASALVEILYLDLVLGHGYRPVDAFQQTLAELPMAGDQGVMGSPFGATMLRIAQ